MKTKQNFKMCHDDICVYGRGTLREKKQISHKLYSGESGIYDMEWSDENMAKCFHAKGIKAEVI